MIRKNSYPAGEGKASDTGSQNGAFVVSRNLLAHPPWGGTGDNPNYGGGARGENRHEANGPRGREKVYDMEKKKSAYGNV